MAAGSWSLVEDLFARGDEQFVRELRNVHFAERLGDFATRWHADSRPFARHAMFEYLSLPFNCYRHEPLVKRLFKLAEKAGDDEIMGAFLVAFDRTIRRARRTRTRYKHQSFPTRSMAEQQVRTWEADGYSNGRVNGAGRQFYAYAWKQEEVVVMPGNTRMPRPAEREQKKNQNIPDFVRQRFEKRFLLFSLPTRRYLRRRAWRYFRTIGKSNPERYLRAALGFLSLYRDSDTDSDIHLLDNWGLVHALFRFSPALACPARGWAFAPGKSIGDLAPAPRFELAWANHPEVVFELMLKANGRTVRQWAVLMLRKDHEGWLAAQPVATFLRLADHDDPTLSDLGFELLGRTPNLESVPIDEWLRRLDGDDLAKLQQLSALLARRLDPARVGTSDVLRLAAHRSKPIAELGFQMLRAREFPRDEAGMLLRLVQAECDSVRPDLMRWLREALERLGPARFEWLLEYLDSKHADVRAAGWEWLNASPLRHEPVIWNRLVESPYDDIRIPLVAALADRVAGAEPDAVRMLWASVLLNIARGGRHKPGVVARVVDRMTNYPGESERLLPALAVAVRSLRGPAFRAGLSGIVQLAEARPELIAGIRERFPELEL
jgi:hypothetical protein